MRTIRQCECWWRVAMSRQRPYRVSWILRRLVLPALLILLLITFWFAKDLQGNEEPRQMVVISATLFDKFLLQDGHHHMRSTERPADNGHSVMVVLFAAVKSFKRRTSLVCEASNGTSGWEVEANVRNGLYPIGECKWTLFIALCKIPRNPSIFTIGSTGSRTNVASIPFREPVKEHLDVVSCLSPLFYNEHWQLLLSGIEIRRTFGVSLQVYYISSMISSLMDILHKYEGLGVLSVEKWALIDVGYEASSYDLNMELEFRNQAGAHTDCFLKYRDAAEFIIISDIDDILFPRLAPTYLEEFLIVRERSGAAAFIYERFTADIYTGRTPEDFSLSSVLRTGTVRNEWLHGKWVADPKQVATAWLHWPGIMNANSSIYNIPYEENFMAHFRHWHFDNEEASDKFHIPLHSLVSHDNINRVQHNYSSMASGNLSSILPSMPREQFYYPLIDECYNKMFYKQWFFLIKCPGPIRCELPLSLGLRCMVASAQYAHTAIEGNLFVHHASDQSFIESFTGCHL